ncbi:putative serine/arginine repetitive matrix protein 2-like 7 [Homarus americanus]|uniref:Putative serine/arginine repetitive matrix protein 2-like 7 n=1 Tax=Homarus americanus TaxID=6706 RepID=A0A8J5N1Z9_HOMAM|nr:putative serine/arginine repetitive matrix protein 2-like 7 [Homarus americanus]
MESDSFLNALPAPRQLPERVRSAHGMEAVGLDLGTSVNYLQDLAVSSDGSNLLDIIDQNVPGYHRVTKTDPFQDPMEEEPMCMHRHQLMTTASAVCETASLDITEDFQKMYSDWQQHLGSLQVML